MNTLGNLLEGHHEFKSAEQLERSAFRLSETKFGPESLELAQTCANLADTLWNLKDLTGAENLYRWEMEIDVSLYGPERPETAAEVANLGVLLRERGGLPTLALFSAARSPFMRRVWGREASKRSLSERIWRRAPH